MKYYNNCKGCGIKLQKNNKNLEGYIPKENVEICQNCFKAKHYGEYKNNLTIFNKDKFLKKIDKNENVLMVIDILNPFETIINEINNYVYKNNLILLINKIDLLQKSIKDKNIINWIIFISNLKKINFKKIILVSSKNKKNIDLITKYILKSKKNTSIIGYSNVGKSSIINSLFKSIGKNVENSISNSIGTTKEIIELNFKSKIIKDFPGFLLNGNLQNLLDKKELDIIHPKKEIKIINYQIKEKIKISIGNYVLFELLDSVGENIQLSFSNELKIEKVKNFKPIFKEIKTIEILNKNESRKDIIISGLGKITFKPNNQKILLTIPKGIHLNIINSLYN